jgi:hypothetical protein
MLFDMASDLPSYETFIEMIKMRREAHSAILPQEGYPGLAKALACVYTDILPFCHQVCRIFSGKQRNNEVRFLSDVYH